MKPGSSNINLAAHCPGIDTFTHMKSRIPQNIYRGEDCANGLCTRVHGVGVSPSIMNRFMQSNWHEVLFVN